MPSMSALLKETLLFTADKSPVALGPLTGRQVSPGVPNIPVFATTSDFERVACWSWTHDALKPNQMKDIGCRVRAMNMQYRMVMPVCTEVTVENLTILTQGERKIELPLTKDFVFDRFSSSSGIVPDASSGLWQLPASTDDSLLIVFAYKANSLGVEPIAREEILKLGERFMPEPGGTVADCTVDETTKVFTCPLRILVCLGFTFNKELNDYAPGFALGMNRFYPHVMVMASQDLRKVQADIVAHRSTTTPHAGTLINDMYADDPGFGANPNLSPLDRMEKPLVHELFADSNVDANALFGALPDPEAPRWDAIFDYYDLEPGTTGVGFSKPVVMVDDARLSERSDTVVSKIGKGKLPAPLKIRKVARQAEFDNVHISPRMAMQPLDLAPTLRAGNIAMAPFCFHDCFHFHTRWGATLPRKPHKGFNAAGVPYSETLAPMVPHNQSVFVTLLGPAGLRYTFQANLQQSGDLIKAGSWTVGCHHGFAYANDAWGNEGRGKVALARQNVETAAKKDGEHIFGGLSPDGKSFGRTADDSWATLYWRLRFGGTQGNPVERIAVPNPKAARTL